MVAVYLMKELEKRRKLLSTFRLLEIYRNFRTLTIAETNKKPELLLELLARQF